MGALVELISELSATGNVLLIGDTNCHFGSEHGTRGWGRTTANGRAFIDAMYKCDMIMIDMCEKTCGPTYTYSFKRGRSYIDHCAISGGLYYVVKSCEVLDDEIRNVSDHLAITTELSLKCVPAPKSPRVSSTFKVAWHKATPEEIRDCYTAPLEAASSKLLHDYGVNPQVILKDQSDKGDTKDINVEHLVQQFIKNTLTACSNLPKIQYNKSLKPYWNKQLTMLSKEQKSTWRAWVSEGRPRDPGNPYTVSYKNAKRNFRDQQRKCTYEFEKNGMKELSETQELDQRYFWYCVNKNKRQTKSIHPILGENGKILTDADEIRREWNDYYSELYSYRENSDEGFATRVTSELQRLDDQVCELSELEGGPITLEETVRELKNMKNRKAPGWDMITSEHLKHGRHTCMDDEQNNSIRKYPMSV